MVGITRKWSPLLTIQSDSRLGKADSLPSHSQACCLSVRGQMTEN